MKAQSQFLQVEMSQAVDSTSGKTSTVGTGMKNQQRSQVPNRGTHSEKTTRNLYEAFFVTVFLLSLFLTGCSNPMTGGGSAREAGGDTVVQASGEAAIPASTSVSTAGAAPFSSAESGDSSVSSFKSFIQEPSVSERVQLVMGWLKFVSQHAAAERVESGWTRLNSGKTIGVLNSSPVLERPDLSTYELMMWRQLLLQSDADQQASEVSKRLEAVAVILTMAVTPDDVMRVDQVLVVPETVAGY